MDSPPSLLEATSKLVRVRVEGFSKRSPTILPLSRVRDLPRLMVALIVFALERTLSISGLDASATERKLLKLDLTTDNEARSGQVVEVHVTTRSLPLGPVE